MPCLRSNCVSRRASPDAYARPMRRGVLVLGSMLACGGDAMRDDTAWVPSTSSSGPVLETGDEPSAETTSTSAANTTSSSGDEIEDPVPDVGVPGFDPLRIAVVSDLNGSYGSTSYESSVHAGVAAVVALAPD